MGGGGGGASYDETVLYVEAGERGAPSGPVNLTFLLSPEGDLSSRGVPNAFDGGTSVLLRSKWIWEFSSSGKPGVATVLQAPDPLF